MERDAPACQAQAGVSGDPVTGDEDEAPDNSLDVSSESFNPLLPLYSLHTLHEGGPLEVLYRCVQERLKVNVHIRTFKGLRGVCSGFVVAFDKFWNMAMVDVDETYRKPVLGKAFYNEPQLTLTRLFDRLKLQESGSQSSTHETGTDRRTSIRDHSRSSLAPGGSTAVQDQGQSGISGDKPKQRARRRKEKTDYQKVYTRHMKQVFIRGESILLVHLPS
ncbi:PREDICTED: U7 snRNA-associated Sm-like protein LSm11 [Nanorana parkeri]|uniref:U7 snRNA-associated Sm-like protein LSm11 n=1 Tax=Nanorana parkeri TaxID=125878 RepID=UPI0008548C67|nr:PREDICTED: U7 snRNA-associated Sm-like protein LSm11 [Nanorana parkeri]